jgi:uncharacterized integral membrane protein
MPAVANGDGGMACARCSNVLRVAPETDIAKRQEARVAAIADSVLAGSPFNDAPPLIDTWRLDAELSEAERLLKAFSPLTSASANPSTQFAAHATRSPFDLATKQTAQSPAAESTTTTSGGVFAWLFLLAGTMALVCGGVLVGYSLYASRPALWNLGLPILLAGQAGLLLGVVLQLARIWQNHRRAAERLAKVDRQLGDLEQTTTLLGNTYGAGSSTFFAHLAEGASPHLLLADLKGQMDLLAMKMSRK